MRRGVFDQRQSHSLGPLGKMPPGAVLGEEEGDGILSSVELHPLRCHLRPPACFQPIPPIEELPVVYGARVEQSVRGDVVRELLQFVLRQHREDGGGGVDGQIEDVEPRVFAEPAHS